MVPSCYLRTKPFLPSACGTSACSLLGIHCDLFLQILAKYRPSDHALVETDANMIGAGQKNNTASWEQVRTYGNLSSSCERVTCAGPGKLPSLDLPDDAMLCQC